ncbi:retrovirus-related pol polyprotein from transposon TNT 1-94, partial [Tanacetum coccineum]
YEKGLPKKAATPQVMVIKGGRIQKANKKSLNAKGKGKGKSKGKDKSYIPKPKNPKPYVKEHPTKDDACHHCKEVGHYKRNYPAYLAELIKKKKQVGTASSSGSRKLKQGALYLCVGNGVRAQVEAIGSYDLVLPSGLVICLDNCHYVPSITRVSKNNVHYLNTIPSDGISEIDMLNLVLNVNSIYNDSYFITFTDDYMYLLKHIHEVFETFKVFKNEVGNQLGKTIKALRSDRGGEYISQEFKDYLKACDYALETATRILNMVPTKKVDNTPYELWYVKVPNLSYLKVWGCEALVKRDTPDKLQQRYVKCIFIGYPKETMGYYLYFPPKNIIVVARYAEFLEKNLLPQEVEGFELPQEEVVPIRRSTRTHQAPDHLCLNVEVEEYSLGDLNEPANYKAAILDLESDKWLDAMNAEMQSMKDNQVWCLVNLPPNSKGSTQIYGVDYEETFSPVDDIRAIRILIAIAALYDYEIWQMDVKTAFLNGKPHLTAVKTILKYLRNIKDMILVYGGNPEAEVRVNCYCNVGFETNRDDIKYQTRYVSVLYRGE